MARTLSLPGERRGNELAAAPVPSKPQGMRAAVVRDGSEPFNIAVTTTKAFGLIQP